METVYTKLKSVLKSLKLSLKIAENVAVSHCTTFYVCLLNLQRYFMMKLV